MMSKHEENVLREIAGSNLSDDEYDPVETPDSPRSNHPPGQNVAQASALPSFGIAKSEKVITGRRVTNEDYQRPLEHRSNFSIKDKYASQHTSARPSAPTDHRVCIHFENGGFQMWDRPALASFFSRHGDVVDVFLPQSCQKVKISL
jgi:hypothetical protein